ncbi:MAG: GDSL-type esterase/lipase family protein [Melioribacteraceae bacterium]|nr:GDSL-type esterase/lipase family protein [Melioribacteraceae bacterium]
MALSNKQKQFIERKKGKLSNKQIAKELKLPLEEVNEFSATIQKKKYPFYFNILLLIIPILLILVLELTLSLVNYGEPFNQWETVDSKKMMCNPEIAKRYFYTTDAVPYPSQDLFDIEKSKYSIRIFILGGSSAAGYPFTPNGSFARYVKKRLELIYPNKTIEIINTAMAAINSYALLDMMPGIIEQKPDLILIYAGHNEYYGALGAGSLESLGNSRWLVNLMLSANKFKTVQLLRNVINGVMSIFSTSNEKGGTLMARMASDQMITLGSSVYQTGINQFEGNLNEMLQMAKEANVKVILSDLASNIKDQPPFVSNNKNDGSSAKYNYTKGMESLASDDSEKVLEFFQKAKDLDALRFRAPSEINSIIRKLAAKYNSPFVSTSKRFNELSPDGIVGNNLMTDHLHPTITGYQEIGKLFITKMLEENLLPDTKIALSNNKIQDKYVRDHYNFTHLDSTIGRYRLKILKADWPFVKTPKSLQQVIESFDVQNFSDSLALFVIDNKYSWERAHRKLATWFFKKGDIENYLVEMDAVIFQYPFVYDYYEMIANNLIGLKMFSNALPYLYKYDKVKETAFGSKWIGIIELSKKKSDAAIKYLVKSLKYNSQDAQVYYNLAGAYSMKQDYKSALDAINSCLLVNPNFNGAKGLQKQLLNAVR